VASLDEPLELSGEAELVREGKPVGRIMDGGMGQERVGKVREQ
jgi:hypothetical protein